MKLFYLFLCLSYILFTSAGQAKVRKKDDILENYFTKNKEESAALEERQAETDFNLNSILEEDAMKNREKEEETLFYHITMTSEKESLANRFFLTYEGFDSPIIPFIGADFYHKQKEHKFSGIGASLGVLYTFFNYKILSVDASFRQSLENWSIPSSQQKIKGITRSSLGVKLNLQATPNFMFFFGFELSNVWGEGTRLAPIANDLRHSIKKRFTHQYGVLIRI